MARGSAWLPQQSTTDWGLQQQKVNLSQFWRLKSKTQGWAGVVPSEGCEGESVPGLSPSFWGFAGHLWCALACRSITPICAFIITWHSPCVRVCVQISPFSKETSHIGLGAHPIPL